ncbi:MAG: homoserine dehydrogenase [Dehalococcoidia bacterium]
MARKAVGLGMLGYGNIGREVFEYYRSGRDGARVVRIARRNMKTSAPASVRSLYTPARDLIRDPNVQVIIELTGDAKQGASYIIDALARGKHVVTANKEALATRWPDMMAAAAKGNASLGFEATVGGGMPVVRTMQRHIAGDDVEGFAGILNGTCNFILTQMKEYILRHLDDPQIQKRSLPLEDALAQAQKLGYAEPDPTKDVNGFDTKFKVAILAGLAFGGFVDPASIACDGILQPDLRIMPSDLYYLHHRRYLGGKYELKLVGVARRLGGRPALRVYPAFIDTSGDLADLATVRDSYNGIVIRSKRLGTQFIKGLGAGPRPTTISIASDVREIAGALLAGGNPTTSLGAKPASLRDADKLSTRGFIRSFSPDVKGVYAKKLEVLARHKVSVQSIVNVREFVYGADKSMPDYIEIDASPDGAVRDVLRDFRKLRGVRDPAYFRILEL